jgi:GDP-L-fucose synthase
MAAKCGGIGANKKSPAVFIHDNLKMGVNLFSAIRIVNGWDTKKSSENTSYPITHFYGVGTTCSYPKYCQVPFSEDNLWNGAPESTNFAYAEAKRSLLMMQKSFRDQFGLKGIHLIPANMFGIEDHFDLENSHVIPALIRKFYEAVRDEKKTVEIWGDGTASREFLYVNDCAILIAKIVTEHCDYEEPVNVGTGIDISIKNLAEKIKNISGFKGEIIYSGDVAINGQPVRRLDVSRAYQLFGFKAKTNLDEGLKTTYKWYKNYCEINNIEKIKESIAFVKKLLIADAKNRTTVLGANTPFTQATQFANNEDKKPKRISYDKSDAGSFWPSGRKFGRDVSYLDKRYGNLISEANVNINTDINKKLDDAAAYYVKKFFKHRFLSPRLKLNQIDYLLKTNEIGDVEILLAKHFHDFDMKHPLQFVSRKVNNFIINSRVSMRKLGDKIWTKKKDQK